MSRTISWLIAARAVSGDTAYSYGIVGRVPSRGGSLMQYPG
ncbi:MAG TPA: hypothetical protein VLZ12_00495 [Verrucomicrobiae bacterium]|nr:hypothetical protein [Verrucomicrobiae bacterium]